ncbi:Serine/threonine-protein kinase SRPK-like protein [Cladobotryum mycophilum]|uniref:EKC/KEOPS complex subunit BUD32 n=1 Tax=Cladobotryum mycophilum TaxID=491253 RepID=A0ABR0SDI1_9HYPO
MRPSTGRILTAISRHQLPPHSRSLTANPAFSPRVFPKTGLKLLSTSDPIEEERIPGYSAQYFYPVELGEVLQSSEVTYLTLKICTRDDASEFLHQGDNELAVCEHLRKSDVRETMTGSVRQILDSFMVTGPHGSHRCLLYQPLGISFTEFRNRLPGRIFNKRLLQQSLQLIVISLHYLHRSGVVHTDISPNNILMGVKDASFLANMEDDEIVRPPARKVLSDRTIYQSRPMPITDGYPVISDLGAARYGSERYRGDVMPEVYRAPEVILDMEWDQKIDIWSIGLMIFDLFEGGRLFFARKNGMLDDEQHLAEIHSLLGPPPLEFLKRSEKCHNYWDEQGNWIAATPIPEQSFEMREHRLQGEDKELLISFMRSILRWLPEERPTAEELAYDDFLMQAYDEVQREGQEKKGRQSPAAE